MKTAQIKLKNSFTPYPEYRDSGISWIGKIPKEWGVDRLKRLFFFQSGDGFPNELQGNKTGSIPFMKVSDINGEKRFIEESNNYVDVKTVRENSWHLVPKDSILMAKIGAALAKNHRKVNTVPVCIDNNMIAAIPRRVIPTYAYWIWRSLNMVDFENVSSVPSINLTLLKDFIFPVPVMEQQKKIAEYLDEKTALIDQIIEKKKKLIELLREKRTAVINDVMMNKDGELGKIKHYVLVNPSKKIVSMTELKNKVSFVPMEALSETGQLTLQERRYEDVKDGFTYFENKDVVLAKITPCYENGKAGVMSSLKNGFGFGTTEFMVLRANKKIFPEYLYFLIFSDKFRKSGEVEMRGTAGQKRVSNSFVKNYEFKLPGLDAQKSTIVELEKRTRLIDSTFEVIEKSIETLKEFKSSLISNVVTGKVKI